MRKSLQKLTLASLTLGLAACGGDAPPDQNFTIENVGAGDIETLPADESSSTASNALVNGTTDDADVPTADNQTDAY